MDQQSTLLNVDILDEIFQWFDYEVIHGHPLMDLVTFKGYKSSRDVEVVRRRSLASASRVCKAFHEPALRVLWRQLESLMPLFSVIEPSFTKVQEDAEQPYDGSFCDTYHLPNHLSAREWMRLRKYATFVRTLYISSAVKPHRLTPDSWKSMTTLFGDQPVCPNLRMLKWAAEWPETELPGILHFLSSTIEKVLLILCTHPERTSTNLLPTWQAVVPGIIEKMCKRATRLSYLTVCTDELDASELLTALSLSHPPTLRGLQLYSQYGSPTIGLTSFMNMARFVGLESLIWDAPIERDSTVSLPTALELHNLRHLRIPIYRECYPAYGIITSARLQSLHIHHLLYASIAYVQQTCATWARCFPNLEVLSTRLSLSDERPVPTCSLLTVASPLLALHKMRSFTIATMHGSFTIGDTDLEALSVAWPSLCELYISGMPIPDNSSASTVGMPGLLSLATNCPNLTALSINHIVFRSEDAPVLPAVPMNHGLRKLVVIHGILPDVYHIIREKFFPKINLQPHDYEGECGLYYAV